LAKLTTLRSQFEQKFAEIDSELGKARTKFDELTTVNEQQDRRLPILEIQEKASALISQGNHRRALDYINVGLQLVPADVTLLRLRADCLMGLNQLDEALSCVEDILRLEPRDVGTVANAAELYLLNRRCEDFDRLLGGHRETLTTRFGPYLPWYLIALRHFFAGDEAHLRQHGRTQPVESPAAKGPRVKGWRFTEARFAVGQGCTAPGFLDTRAA